MSAPSSVEANGSSSNSNGTSSMLNGHASKASNGHATPHRPDTATVPDDTSGCEHTRALRSHPDQLRRFRAGLRWGRMIRAGQVLMDEEDEPPEGVDRSKLLAYPECGTCTVALHRPFLCLDCAHAACHTPARVPPSPGIDDSHMLAHCKDQGHTLAFEIHSGAVLCAACEDLVYDARLEHIVQQEHRRLAHPGRTRKRPAPPEWDGKDDIKRTPDWKLAVPCKAPRGLRNMGATCYMNVVLQSFIHNPLLRNFFLSDRHNSSLCTNRENCLACEIDLLFHEFFTGDAHVTAFGPTNLLFTLWLARESSEIASTGQHDAHELFISMANAMHSALTQSNLGAPPLSHTEDQARHRSEAIPTWPWESLYPAGTRGGKCACAVHRTFSGTIQSDVTCQQCGRWNSTKDPFLDISLDLKPPKPLENGTNGSANGTNGPKPELDLIECLRRYTRAESLDVAGYSCPNCGSNQATKQLSFLRFPLVLCLQLKRFEHNSSASKIDNPIRYPLSLDLRDFATSMVQGETDKTLADPEAYIYDLFTSVLHEGTLTTGHYTNYSKFRDQWYFYDDDKVRPVPTRQALNGNAYQLCYRRRRLHNLATTDDEF